MITFGLVLVYLIVLGIAIGIQYILFRSVVAVVVVTLVVGLGTYFLTKLALANFESRIRFQLNSPDFAASGSMFHYEVE